jgi:hypothetical protein
MRYRAPHTPSFGRRSDMGLTLEFRRSVPQKPAAGTG